MASGSSIRSAPIFAATLWSLVLGGCALDAGRQAVPAARTAPAPSSVQQAGQQAAPAPAPLPLRAVPGSAPYRLTTPPPATASVPILPATRPAPVLPSAPQPLMGCDPGGCRNAGGNRYNGGTGDSYLDRNGRLCQRNGNWMQCF